VPVRRGRPLKFAVTGVVPIKVVRADSIAPVTVVTKELVVVGDEVPGVVVWEVRLAVSNESTAESLTPGEQPTKFGADSLTAAQDAMLNAMASASHQRCILTRGYSAHFAGPMVHMQLKGSRTMHLHSLH
jgi:hypothetical protein